jgi:hypothetical protein
MLSPPNQPSELILPENLTGCKQNWLFCGSWPDEMGFFYNKAGLIREGEWQKGFSAPILG